MFILPPTPSFNNIWLITMGLLGFYRGINAGIYHHKKLNNEYLYVNTLGYGVYGVCVYINPVLLPITLYKEVYRLEVNIRNLEDQKKTSFYNNIV